MPTVPRAAYGQLRSAAALPLAPAGGASSPLEWTDASTSAYVLEHLTTATLCAWLVVAAVWGHQIRRHAHAQLPVHTRMSCVLGLQLVSKALAWGGTTTMWSAVASLLRYAALYSTLELAGMLACGWAITRVDVCARNAWIVRAVSAFWAAALWFLRSGCATEATTLVKSLFLVGYIATVVM